MNYIIYIVSYHSCNPCNLFNNIHNLKIQWIANGHYNSETLGKKFDLQFIHKGHNNNATLFFHKKNHI